MELLHRQCAQNWSDVEFAIGELLNVDGVGPEIIAADLKAVQQEFSTFLDQVATPELLGRSGARAVVYKQTMAHFTEFLGRSKTRMSII